MSDAPSSGTGSPRPVRNASLPGFCLARAGQATVDWLRTRFRQRHPIVLLGHSVGATAVLLATARRGNIAAVVSLSAFAHPALVMGRMPRRLPKPLTAFILAYVQWVIGHRFQDIAPINTTCRVHCPVLLVHGADDATAPHSDSVAIANRCRHEGVELLLIDGADHDSVEEIEAHGRRLTAFVERHAVAG